jgi:mandelamide amidase
VTWIEESAVIEAARRLDRRRAQGESLGPLGGIPVLIKDNIDTVGFPTTAGAHIFRNLRPRANARLVERLLSLGAIVFGKANMHELAAGGTTTNPTYGTTRNPHARTRVPGGSSGGSGAAVGAGIVPLSLGSDTAGSVRIPAAYCGVAGLRPTVRSREFKSYSSEGLLPFSVDLDTIGPFARTVSDLSFIDSVIRGIPPSKVPRPCDLRIGLPIQYYWDDLDSQVADVISDALAKLKSAGVQFVHVDVSGYVQQAVEGFRVLAFDAGFRGDFVAFLAKQGMNLEQAVAGVRARDVQALIGEIMAGSNSAEVTEHARFKLRPAAQCVYASVLKEHRLDCLLFPTVALLPPEIRERGDEAHAITSINGKNLPTNYLMIRNTLVTSFLGAPGLSLPAGMTAFKLPVGLELDGLPGGDASVLAVGRAIESVLGILERPIPFSD